MQEILSQTQIDQILNGIASGEFCEEEIDPQRKGKRVKDYDFRSPKKFTKEQLRTLSSIYDNYGRHLSSFFTGSLRTFCQVEVMSIEEQRYYEYNNALPESILMGVVELKPMEGSVLIEFSRAINYAVIDRLLGGNGEYTEVTHDYTEIEMALMDRIFRQIIVFLKEAWSNVAVVEPVLNQFVTNSRLTQLMPLDEVVVIVVMKVTIKSVSGTMSICLPWANIQSVIDKMSTKQWFTQRKNDSEDKPTQREAVLSRITSSQLELRGVLGGTVLSLREVLQLQVGDVVQLDQAVGSEVQINAGNSTWFYGNLGIKKNKMAIRVSTVVE